MTATIITAARTAATQPAAMVAANPATPMIATTIGLSSLFTTIPFYEKKTPPRISRRRRFSLAGGLVGREGGLQAAAPGAMGSTARDASQHLATRVDCFSFFLGARPEGAVVVGFASFHYALLLFSMRRRAFSARLAGWGLPMLACERWLRFLRLRRRRCCAVSSLFHRR